MTKLYYIPAATEQAARAVVNGIEVGRIPALPEYLDAELAAANFERYPLGHRRGLRLWCIERRAVDDTRITNVWTIDRVGEIAAALTLFAVAPAVLAAFWRVIA